MTGVFVPIVGPSGAGKDTLIAAARSRLAGDPRFHFVRRVVTRHEGGNEEHDTAGLEEFAARRAAGEFVLAWGAHGLFYGIPASALSAVAVGRVVVANLSRGAVVEALAAFPAVRVVEVTAPPEVIAARLAARAREGAAEIERRLARPAPALPAGTVALANDGPLERSAARLVALLEDLARSGVAQ